MDFAEIWRSIKKQEAGDYTTVYNQQQMLDSGFIEMKRHEMDKNKSCLWLIPMQLQIPFHPFDPLNDVFSAKKPFIVEGDNEDFVLELKEYLDKPENKELKAIYAKLGKMTVDEYDTSDTKNITKQDIAIFAKLRKPVVPSKWTQKFTTEEAGQLGVERQTLVRLDNQGKVLPECEGYLLAQYLEYEKAIRKEKYAEFKLNNPDQSKLDADKKAQKKAIKQSMKLSHPKLSGVLLCYEFPCDTENEELGSLDSSELGEYLTWLNCGRETLDKLQKKVGKKADTNLNYMIVLVTYGDGKGEKTLTLNLYSSREYTVKQADDSDYNLKEAFKDFDTVVKETIKAGLEGEFVKAIENGIFKYSYFSDSEVIGYMSGRMEENKPYTCKEIFNQFNSLIEKTNLELYKELEELEAQGKLPVSYTAVVNANAIAENKEANLDELDEEDEKEAAESELGSEIEELENGSELSDLVE